MYLGGHEEKSPKQDLTRAKKGGNSHPIDQTKLTDLTYSLS